VIKEACPKARLLINTNGYLTNQIKKLIPQIKKHDEKIAVRVSLDGWGKTHYKIRRLPIFFEHAIDTLNYLRQFRIKDLGISYTLMGQNINDLLKLYEYSKTNNLEFSLTVASDSPIYFGVGKISLRPRVNRELTEIFTGLTNRQYKSGNPKDWVRAWFNQKLFEFIDKKTRYFICNASEDFFYLDSLGKIYTCHLKAWQMGDLNKQSFEKIWFSKRANTLRERAKGCHDCWMVCTARASIKKNLLKVLKEIFINKLSAQFLI
jgi:radical SAM protein with 4Fe4S-binding SPASM domain